VRRLRRLADRRADRWHERCFVVEGAKVLSEALSAGATIESVYLEPSRADAETVALAERCRAAGSQLFEVQAGVLERACDAVHGPPVAGVVKMLDRPLERIVLCEDSLVVVCAGTQDPGNAGAIVRSAGAAGATAAVFCDDSVDVYNPKTVRASAGALFRLPVVVVPGGAQVVGWLAGNGFKTLAAVPSGGAPYMDIDLSGRTALLLGGEARGLPADLIQSADGLISIPMKGDAESLNVAMAASVLCFEAARQRKSGTKASGPSR
jgi:TrmH family RNA methyltransferase